MIETGAVDEVRFFTEQDASYSYHDWSGDPDSGYPGYNEYYYAGLDCSGYIGWVLYNTFETEDGKGGYVVQAKEYAKTLAGKGWGTWSQNANNLKPGDIVSLSGHVWICLGRCEDGSILCVHSTASRRQAWSCPVWRK